jgi:hypothetical protein
VTRWQQCKRRIFVNRLRKLGFTGPFSGTRHQFMIYKQHRLAIPSNKEFSVPQIHVIIHEAERIIERKIPAEEWEKL